MNSNPNALDSTRIAVDIGGTFTDVVLESQGGQRVTTKLLTTYDHPGRAVLNGISTVLEKAGLLPADVDLIIHGTTLATNALIERRGAVTALLTTEGHRDVLEMAHEDRFEQYDINIDRPLPLVPRYLRLPVRERMDRNGEVLIPLDTRWVDACLPLLEEHQVESVAIGYLHAFVNREHEERTREILAAARPDLSITLASEVCPEIREYERLSTACANAYVQPLMARYLRRLGGELQKMGLACPFLLMTSGGGLTTLETAARFPIRLVESGPAGGAILAQAVAQQGARQKILSFDMGGTTAKLCMIDDFQALSSRSFEVDRVYRFKKGSGLPIRIPVIEMVEIGAGGGSIAHVDTLNRIQVGPGSAGSEPGPAAYGLGGEEPTVTDADVQQGKVYAPLFAGGAFELRTEASATAIDRKIAGPLSMQTNEAAWGIGEVVDENMASAARSHAAEYGMDLTSRDMVAFGGAAPLHAARLAEKLGVNRIIIPADAGVGSAVGFLIAPIAYEVVRSRRQSLRSLDTNAINDLMEEMKDEAMNVVSLGTGSDPLIETRQAYMRYHGQGHEIPVSLPVESYEAIHASHFKALFEASYKKLYGHVMEGIDVEVLSWTLTISEPIQPPPEDRSELNSEAISTSHSAPDPCAHQPLFDPTSGKSNPVPVYRREDILDGVTLNGPALIVEPQTTTLVTGTFTFEVDDAKNIVLTRNALSLS